MSSIIDSTTMARYLVYTEECGAYEEGPLHPPALASGVSSGATTTSSTSARTLSSQELRLPLHTRLSPVRSTTSESAMSDESGAEARPVERSVCRNCNFVFLAAYSPVGPTFCSLDCRTSFGLHLSDDEQQGGPYAEEEGAACMAEEEDTYAGGGYEPAASFAYGSPYEPARPQQPQPTHTHMQAHHHAGVCAAPYAAYPAPRAADEVMVAPVLRGGSTANGVCLVTGAQIASLENRRQAAAAPLYRPSCEVQAYRAGDGGSYYRGEVEAEWRQRSIRNV